VRKYVLMVSNKVKLGKVVYRRLETHGCLHVGVACSLGHIMYGLGEEQEGGIQFHLQYNAPTHTQ
jgi:hypothetical protein